MGLEQKGMKEMIRKLDKLGRICIPKEFRKTYNWHDLQEVEIIEKDGKIINIDLSTAEKLYEYLIKLIFIALLSFKFF